MILGIYSNEGPFGEKIPETIKVQLLAKQSISPFIYVVVVVVVSPVLLQSVRIKQLLISRGWTGSPFTMIVGGRRETREVATPRARCSLSFKNGGGKVT